MEKEIIIKHGMRKEIAKILGISEQTVYNALRGLTKGKKSDAARRLALKMMDEYSK